MKRKLILSTYCVPDKAPKLKIKPPLFSSALEAYNQFIRHPEDFPISEDEDAELPDAMQGEIFDLMDNIMLSSRSESAERSEAEGQQRARSAREPSRGSHAEHPNESEERSDEDEVSVPPSDE